MVSKRSSVLKINTFFSKTKTIEHVRIGAYGQPFMKWKMKNLALTGCCKCNGEMGMDPLVHSLLGTHQRSALPILQTLMLH